MNRNEHHGGVDTAEWRTGANEIYYRADGGSYTPVTEDLRHDWGRCPGNGIPWLLKTKKDTVAKAQAKTTITFLAKIEKFRNEFENYIHKGDYKKKKDAVFKDKETTAQNFLKEMQDHSKMCSVFERE